MVESILALLIYICLVVGVCWLVIWVLEQLGVAIPAQVVKILWVVVVLVVILLMWRTLGPQLSLGRI